MPDAEVREMSHSEVIAEEFSSNGAMTPWTFAVIIAVSMVLPAVGMIVDGFIDGSPTIAYVGVGLLIATAIAYYIVLWNVVLSHLG